MLERKFWLKNRIEKERGLSIQYWNEDCKRAWEKADQLMKKLANATTDTATTTEESCSATSLGEGVWGRERSPTVENF